MEGFVSKFQELHSQVQVSSLSLKNPTMYHAYAEVAGEQALTAESYIIVVKRDTIRMEFERFNDVI